VCRTRKASSPAATTLRPSISSARPPSRWPSVPADRQEGDGKSEAREKYDEIAASGAKFGLVKEEDAQLEDYVTRKALDGLFIAIAEEEKKIRRDPAGAASAILRKVFGALK